MSRDRIRQRMATVVRAWASSGESRQVFAKRHGISVSALDYWRRRVRHVVEREPSVAFAPVQVMGQGDTLGTIEIELPTGERLTIRGGTSVELVQAVLQAVRASC